MARPHADVPTPGKRPRGAGWQIFWRAGGKFYGIAAPGPEGVAKTRRGAVPEGQAEIRRLEVALALRTREWPAWAARNKAVQRYTMSKAGAVAGDLLSAYESSLQAEVSATWTRTVMGHLRELQSVAGKALSEIDGRDAQAFLDHVATTPGPFLKGRGRRSAATRNRALASCGRLYKWAVRTERLVSNPFDGIGRLPERDLEQIIYLTRSERDQVLQAAAPLPDGVSVSIALWAGLRRGEVAACHWQDVNLDSGRIAVPKTKTGRRRVVPIAESLRELLAARIPERPVGRIVPWPAETRQWEWQARCLLKTLAAACPGIPRERIRWNAFRHTFGSLLAQAGVSLDKIAAWMGNSSAICRRHYAEFVPRDHRDDEIDRL